MKFAFTTIVMLAMCWSSFAQTGSITGKVIDQDNLFLPGASVFIPSLNKGVATKPDGSFTLISIPEGTHELEVSFIGYEKAQKSVTVEAGQTTNLKNIVLSVATLEGQEIIVLGDRLKGQAKALSQQRSNANVTNVVEADQIGRFPDANIGDALKRIPGITMQYDQGEARFGLIRGTSARLNSVMINGERVPSAEAEVREVQLDLVPADMIQTIEVNKTILPDMDADAIGGAVNLITRAAPNGLRVSGTAASGYNFLSEKPIWTGALVVGNRFLDNKLGVILSASYNDHILGSDNVEAEWDQDEETGEFWMNDLQIRKYDVQRIRRSASMNLDYEISKNHKLYLRSMYNWRDDWENRYRLRFGLDDGKNDGNPNENGIVTGETAVRIQTKGGIGNDRVDNRRLEDQRMQSYQLGGEHLLNNLILTWSGSYAKASEERPNERYIEWEQEEENIFVDISDLREPQARFADPTRRAASNFELREITEEYQYTEDEDFNARIDLKIPLSLNEKQGFIKMGGRLRSKDKLRNNNFFEYSPLDEDAWSSMNQFPLVNLTDGNYLAGNYELGNVSTPEFLGALDLDNPALFEREDKIDEYAGGNYTATELITGGYVMWNQSLSNKFSFIAGVRLENTNLEYTGNVYQIDEEGEESVNSRTDSDTYLNILPSMHLKYDLNDNTILRLAWTNTLARPNYFDLVPYRLINLEDNEIAIGNPDLEPTVSMNFDLMAEKYFESIGLVSGGVFYKDLSDFIFTYQQRDLNFEGITYDQFDQPLNGGGASIFGLELAIQRQFDFLPGIWKGLGIYGNYTYTHSAVDGIPITERANEDIALPGTAAHTANASLSFETRKLVLRLSLNYTSAYLDELGDNAFFDRFYDAQTFVDANGSYAFTDKLRIFVEANNLTNQPLRYYQGSVDRTMQAEFYNARFNLGLKFDINK